MTATSQFLYRAEGSEKLLKVQFVVGADASVGASDYWTVELRRVKTGQSFGETVASFTTASRTLTANQAVTLYDVARGLAMSDGDELRSVVTSTGSPAALSGPIFRVLIQRMVR